MRYERIIAAAPDDYYVYRGGTVERRQRTPEQLRAIYENTKARMSARFPAPILAEHDTKHPLGRLDDIELTEVDNKQAIKAYFELDDEEYAELLDKNLIWTSPCIRRNDFVGIPGDPRRGDYIQELTLTKEPASRDWNEPERLSKGVIETEIEDDMAEKSEANLIERLFSSFSDREKAELKAKLEEAEATIANAEEALSKKDSELKALEEKASKLEEAEKERKAADFSKMLADKGYSPAQVEALSKKQGEILADETWLEAVIPEKVNTEPLSQNTGRPTADDSEVPTETKAAIDYIVGKSEE